MLYKINKGRSYRSQHLIPVIIVTSYLVADL